jgi:hypothetical protein
MEPIPDTTILDDGRIYLFHVKHMITFSEVLKIVNYLLKKQVFWVL